MSSSPRDAFRVSSILSLIFIMLFSWSGCGRAIEEGPMVADRVADVGQLAPASYDDYGRLHNEALDYLDANRASPQDPDRAEGLLRSFLASRGVDPDEAVADSDVATQFGETYLANGPTRALSELADVGIISPLQRTYLEGVVAAISTLQAQPSPLQRIQEHILNVESQVIADARLSAGERDALLKAFSVMRYSADHWYGKALQEISVEKLSKACKDCLKRNWWVLLIYDGLAALQAAVLGPWGAIGVAILVSFIMSGVACPQCY